MILAAAGLMTLAIFFATTAVASFVTRPNLTAERLSGIAASGPRGAYDIDEDDSTVGDRLLRPFWGWLAQRAAALLPTSAARHFEQQLARAGGPISLAAFLVLLTLTPGVLAVLGAGVLLRSGSVSPVALLMGALVGAGLGVAIPVVWLRGRISRRELQIRRELPDALDLLVVSVEAGLGLEGALARVAESREGPVAGEVRRVLADMNLGLGRRRALQNLSTRTGVPAFRALVAAILQADQTGMGLGQVLRAQSEHLRTQRRQTAEESAMKAPLKMLFPLVLFIFPSLFVVILAPAVITLLDSMSAS